MKIARLSIALSAVLGVVGCASMPPLVVADAVGPLQPLQVGGPQGSLIVYTDTQGPVADPGDYSPYTGYKLHSADGQLLQTVVNRGTNDAREPKTLQLGVGTYRVTGIAAGVGLVDVPVVIDRGEVTVVDLKRQLLSSSQVAGEQWVRLPNGQVIGSRARQ